MTSGLGRYSNKTNKNVQKWLSTASKMAISDEEESFSTKNTFKMDFIGPRDMKLGLK